MRRHRLTVFGGFRLFGPDGGEIAVPGRKLRAFLAYLALHADRRLSREHLATLFWDDKPDRQARQNLRKTLARLRRLFRTTALDALETDGEYVRLSTRDLAVDALELRDPNSAMDVTALYAGDLLPETGGIGDAFDTWLVAERSAFAELALAAHLVLVEHHEAKGDFEDAIAGLDRALAIEPFREDLLRRSMQLSTRVGRARAALKKYRDFALLIRDELDVAPENSTVEAYHAILPQPAKSLAETASIGWNSPAETRSRETFPAAPAGSVSPPD